MPKIVSIGISADWPYRPFDCGAGELVKSVKVQSIPSDEDIADGFVDPFDWLDLRYVHATPTKLIDGSEVILKESTFQLVIDYPFEPIALIECTSTTPVTRAQLCLLIHEAYSRIYQREEETSSSKTPAREDRGKFSNRPASDGDFKISGHDFEDLGIENVDIYEVEQKFVLYPNMCS